MNPAQQITLWADQLRDCSADGLLHSPDIYHHNRYRTIQSIAMSMLALAAGTTLEQVEPLRGTIFSRPTPLTGGDAAIIDDAGHILLIQRSDNGKWAMPGGALEVGETPAEGVVREALEETGINCEPVRLVGIFDSRFRGTINRHHLYQIVFLCKPLALAGDKPSHANEALQTAWFSESNLPGDIDPGHATVIPKAFQAWHGDKAVFFDRISSN